MHCGAACSAASCCRSRCSTPPRTAPFLAFVQVIVYTGAVMMLFLFVLMLIGVDTPTACRDAARAAGGGGRRRPRFRCCCSPGIRQAAITSARLPVRTTDLSPGQRARTRATSSRSPSCCSPVTSSLSRSPAPCSSPPALGAMVLAHRERHEPRRTPARADARAVQGRTPPDAVARPGRVRRHNAVDTPALLPDGVVVRAQRAAAVEESRLERGRDPRPAELDVAARDAQEGGPS